MLQPNQPLTKPVTSAGGLAPLITSYSLIASSPKRADVEMVSMIRTTPATPLSPLRMQNDHWRWRFCPYGHLQVVDNDLRIYPTT